VTDSAIPEHVYLDAARADARAYATQLGAAEMSAEGHDGRIAQRPTFRAAVESAYRAGYDQALADLTDPPLSAPERRSTP
jgi:hypothetical protein